MWSRYSKLSAVSACGIGITASAFLFVAAPGAIAAGMIGLVAANYSIDHNFLSQYSTRVGEDVAKKLECSLRLYSDNYDYTQSDMNVAHKVNYIILKQYTKDFGTCVSQILDGLDKKEISTEACDVKKIEAIKQFTMLPNILKAEPHLMRFYTPESKKFKVTCFHLMREIEKSIQMYGGVLSLFKRPLAEQVVHYLEKEGKIDVTSNLPRYRIF